MWPADDLQPRSRIVQRMVRFGLGHETECCSDSQRPIKFTLWERDWHLSELTRVQHPLYTIATSLSAVLVKAVADFVIRPLTISTRDWPPGSLQLIIKASTASGDMLSPSFARVDAAMRAALGAAGVVPCSGTAVPSAGSSTKHGSREAPPSSPWNRPSLFNSVRSTFAWFLSKPQRHWATAVDTPILGSRSGSRPTV